MQAITITIQAKPEASTSRYLRLLLSAGVINWVSTSAIPRMALTSRISHLDPFKWMPHCGVRGIETCTLYIAHPAPSDWSYLRGSTPGYKVTIISPQFQSINDQCQLNIGIYRFSRAKVGGCLLPLIDADLTPTPSGNSWTLRTSLSFCSRSTLQAETETATREAQRHAISRTCTARKCNNPLIIHVQGFPIWTK